jgi:hypothetical protein
LKQKETTEHIMPDPSTQYVAKTKLREANLSHSLTPQLPTNETMLNTNGAAT